MAFDTLLGLTLDPKVSLSSDPLCVRLLLTGNIDVHSLALLRVGLAKGCKRYWREGILRSREGRKGANTPLFTASQEAAGGVLFSLEGCSKGGVQEG
jgi:hypothetical protein